MTLHIFSYFNFSEKKSHVAAESIIGVSWGCVAHMEFSIQDPEAGGVLECEQPG